MKAIVLTLQIELWVFLLALAVMIGYRMLTGTINTKGLLSAKGDHLEFSPARLQLLLATLAVAVYYIGEILVSSPLGGFPTIPNEMLFVLGGSHALYLGSKSAGLITEALSRFRK